MCQNKVNQRQQMKNASSRMANESMALCSRNTAGVAQNLPVTLTHLEGNQNDEAHPQHTTYTNKKTGPDPPERCPMDSKRILYLVALQSWDLLRSYLSTHEGIANAETYGLVVDKKGHTALHLAFICRSDLSKTFNNNVISFAPLDILEKLVNACPEATAVKDCCGCTPLHLAASASSSVVPFSVSTWRKISFLVSKSGEAVSVKDNEGKTPLISFCAGLAEKTSACSDKNVISASQRARGLLSITELLCKASAESIAAQDDYAMTAKEYASKAGAHRAILNLLSTKMEEKTFQSQPKEETCGSVAVQEDGTVTTEKSGATRQSMRMSRSLLLRTKSSGSFRRIQSFSRRTSSSIINLQKAASTKF